MGGKKGKGKKFKPFNSEALSSNTKLSKSSCSNDVLSNSDNVKENKNRNRDGGSVSKEKYINTVNTSDSLETSADLSINSNCTNISESTDNSNKSLDNESTGSLSVVVEVKINSKNQDSRKVVTSGIENLSVSSHSDESFSQHKTYTDNSNYVKERVNKDVFNSRGGGGWSNSQNQRKNRNGADICQRDKNSSNERNSRDYSKNNYKNYETYNTTSQKTNRGDRRNKHSENSNSRNRRMDYNQKYKSPSDYSEQRTNANNKSEVGKSQKQGSIDSNKTNYCSVPENENWDDELNQQIEPLEKADVDPTKNVSNNDWSTETFDDQCIGSQSTNLDWSSKSFSSLHVEGPSNQNWEETSASNSAWYEESEDTQNKLDRENIAATDDYYENNIKWENMAKQDNQNWRHKDVRRSVPTTSRQYSNVSKRHSEGNYFGNKNETSDKRDSKVSQNRDFYDRRSESTDKEYKAFCDEEKKKETVEFTRVTEIQGDLFAMPKEYSLAHCVAEDLKMGSGIAVAFKREFKDLGVLYDQKQKQGGLAVLESESNDGTRYIYYLVTKRESTGKPTYEKFWSSLKKMRNHIRKNNVKKLAIPRLGCGLDRLEWVKVKHMIEFLFRDVDTEITVCNFQQNHGQTKQKLQTASDVSKKKTSKAKKKKK